MYSESDLNEIKGRIRKNLLVLLPLLAALLAVYVVALIIRVEWLAMAAGALLFVAACYGFLAYLLPNLRYKVFLTDMQSGLSREMRGRIVSIADEAETQDGARVLPVHLLLTEEQDERIVYLNASKRAGFPEPGAEVLLRCFGRHIKAVSRV